MASTPVITHSECVSDLQSKLLEILIVLGICIDSLPNDLGTLLVIFLEPLSIFFLASFDLLSL